jgi:hypothetical protein
VGATRIRWRGLIVGFTIQKSKLDMPVRRAYRPSQLHLSQTASNESPSQPPRGFRPFVIYPTDKMLGSMPECKMETQSTSQIACVDTLDGGVLVEFEDGRCALYSASCCVPFCHRPSNSKLQMMMRRMPRSQQRSLREPLRRCVILQRQRECS